MNLSVYTVFDSAVGAYLQPFYARSSGEAIRSFSDACNDPKSQFYAHSMDYTLFLLGTFDDAGGVFDSHPPQRILSATEVINTDDPLTPAPWLADSKIKIGQR